MTKFDRYSEESGLSSNKCLKIFQDRYGYIWIGTDNGLNRFDGHSFIQYMHSENDSLSLSGNFISDIAEDSEGNLWIATHSGLNLYDRKKEEFIHIKENSTKNSLQNNHIRALLADSSWIWIETLDGTLSKYDIHSRKFKHYKHQKISQPYYTYHSLIKDNDGEIWLGGRNMGPAKFNPEKETFTYYEPGDINKSKKRDRDVACYFIDHSDTFWISATDGIYQFNKTSGLFKRVFATSTFSIIQDEKRNIWFGTGKGAIKYNPILNESTLFLYDENNTNSISDNHINQIYEDEKGNIWVATNNRLSKYSEGTNQIGNIYHIPENTSSLASNKISTIIEGPKGNLWIGYEDDGFDKYNIQNGTVKHYNKETFKRLKSNLISKLYYDNENKWWIGLLQGVGFHKLDPNTDQMWHYTYDPNTRKRDWYSDFLEDTYHNFWVGFWGSKGVHLFNRKTESFEPNHFKPANKPLEQSIHSLLKTKNKIWIGSNNGQIYQYDLQDSSFKSFANGNGRFSEFDKINYLKLFPFRAIFKIISDSFNHEWFITNNGIIEYKPTNAKFSSYPAPENKNIQLRNSNKTCSWLLYENKLYEFNFNNRSYRLIDFPEEKTHEIKFIYKDNSNLYFITKNNNLETASKENHFIEIKKFEYLASRWWYKSGEFKPLHDIIPLRLAYIDQRCGGLARKTVIDVGCGGGILAEWFIECAHAKHYEGSGMLLLGVVGLAHGRGKFLHWVDSGWDGGCMRDMYWCGSYFCFGVL